MKPSVIATAIFLLLISTVHLLRLILQWKVTVNTVEMPMWGSAVAGIVTVVLAFWLLRENKPTKA